MIAYLREHGTNVNSIIRSDIIGALAKAESQIPGFSDLAISSLAGTNVWQQAFAALVEPAVPTLIEALRKADDDWERPELLDALGRNRAFEGKLS